MSEEVQERQPDERIRNIARALHEPKVGLLQKLADHVGIEQVEELFQRTLEIEAAGGLYTANGKRRRTAGGVLFQLTRELMSPRERRQIFRERKPHQPGDPTQPAGQREPKASPSAPQPPTSEEVAALLKAAASIPAEKKGAASVKVTLIGRPKQVKKLDTCVLVVMAPKSPGTLPKGLPPIPPATNATLAVFIATKQWAKVEAALKQDPNDELIVEGFPSNDAKNQITAVWAQSCTTKLIQRNLRQQKERRVRRINGCAAMGAVAGLNQGQSQRSTLEFASDSGCISQAGQATVGGSLPAPLRSGWFFALAY